MLMQTPESLVHIDRMFDTYYLGKEVISEGANFTDRLSLERMLRLIGSVSE